MYEILSRYMYENYFCGVICMIKKISAAAIAVIMSASMMFTTASADASYVLDKDAGEDFVNFIDGKLPDILKSMDSVADGDKIYFDYGSWNICIAPSCAICVVPFTNCFLLRVSF